MTCSRTKFYLDKQRAKWSGVCAGIADYTGINVFWVRIAAVIATVTFACPWTLSAYWVGAEAFGGKPGQLCASEEERQWWQGARECRGRTARDVRSRFREIDRRLAD